MLERRGPPRRTLLDFTCCVIADAECHVPSLWDHATHIIFNQPRALSTQTRQRSIEARRETFSNEGEAET
jgi:hypothetical protein